MNNNAKHLTKYMHAKQTNNKADVYANIKHIKTSIFIIFFISKFTTQSKCI